MTQDFATADSVLRHRSFVLFWLSRVFSAIAFQVSAVAVGWQVYALTGSVFDLGMVGLVQFLPMIALGLVAGHIADRCDRRLVARTCQIIMGGAAAVLALGSFEGWVHTKQIFASIAVIGAARSFEHPTMAALLPGLVPAKVFPKAAALSGAAIQTAFIVGPALGGVLYAAGPTVPYALAASLFVTAGVFSSLIKTAKAPAPPPRQDSHSVFSGIAFIRSRPVILGAISLDLFAVLFGGATALLPVYARDILHTGPWGLGLLRSAPAVGAFFTSLVLTRKPLKERVGRIMFAAVIVFGAATVIFGLSSSLVLSLVSLFVLGSADLVSVVIRMTLVQLSTPDHMRGRVSAVNSVFVGTSNQLGEFESGVAAALLGTVPAVVLGGLGSIMVAIAWMRLFPELRDSEGFEIQSG